MLEPFFRSLMESSTDIYSLVNRGEFLLWWCPQGCPTQVPGVEEQKAIKSFSIWAFLMASYSKSSGGSEELFSEDFAESFNHTTPWFSERARFDFLLLVKRITFSPKPLFIHLYWFICHCLSFTCIYTHTSQELYF